MMRAVPDQSILLSRQFEGFERRVKRGLEITAVPYVCPAGFWTIGFGHLCDESHPPITEAQGETYLMQDMASALAQTLRLCPGLAVESDSRLGAIVDFTFNLGAGRLAASTLRRRINQRDWTGAAAELGKWVWGGGRKLPGLMLRREAEVRLLLT